MFSTRFYSVHLRTLVVALIIPALVGAWWWISFIEPAPVLAPTEAVSGKRIAIDPGHGGTDPGAVGISGALEKDIVLAVSRTLDPLFRQAAMYTYLIRELDEDLSDDVGSLLQQKRTDLAMRVRTAKEAGADVYLSLHANSFPSPRWFGAQTFFYPGDTESEALAVAIQTELRRMAPDNNRLARPGEYYVLRHAEMPAVVIELGFLSHPIEERLLTDPDYQSRLATAIFRGVIRYFVERSRG